MTHLITRKGVIKSAWAADINKRLFLLLCVAGSVAILSTTMAKNPALPLLAKDIGASDSQIGLIAAMSPIPGILISALAGAYSDRVGRTTLLNYSLLVFATAPLLYLIVNESWELAAVRFYHGFATAIFMPVAMAAVADMYDPSQRGRKLALYSSATMAGRSIAPFLGGTILYFTTFGNVYIACEITGALALLVAMTIPWEKRGPSVVAVREKGVLKSLGSVARDKVITTTSMMEGAQYYAMGAFEAFVPIYGLSTGLNELEIGIVMGVQILSMLISKPFLGAVSDAKGRKPGIVLGLALGGFVMIGFPQVSGFLAMCLLSVVFGVSVAMVTASTSALVSERAGPSKHGSSIGLLSSIMDVGHSLGPLATGILIGAFSFTFGFGIAGLVLLAGAFAFTVIVWRRGPAL